MPHKCSKFEEAIENEFIDMNYDETYDICNGDMPFFARYMIITYCPFCGEKL